eukprot:CAMPEP_0175165946 /NCGR_PEP_ID=MMETSP0087-20121206/27400_1 /TAXON_ID=136419 /ORGANISM="Unknown Unknown, Strain D1" /LENGTH=325 /DNA_ID=CAMNT_0016455443 /DNA_START=32 /DNA_END=1005 /DNA_ORIENTATION=+
MTVSSGATSHGAAVGEDLAKWAEERSKLYSAHAQRLSTPQPRSRVSEGAASSDWRDVLASLDKPLQQRHSFSQTVPTPPRENTPIAGVPVTYALLKAKDRPRYIKLAMRDRRLAQEAGAIAAGHLKGSSFTEMFQTQAAALKACGGQETPSYTCTLGCSPNAALTPGAVQMPPHVAPSQADPASLPAPYNTYPSSYVNFNSNFFPTNQYTGVHRSAVRERNTNLFPHGLPPHYREFHDDYMDVLQLDEDIPDLVEGEVEVVVEEKNLDSAANLEQGIAATEEDGEVEEQDTAEGEEAGEEGGEEDAEGEEDSDRRQQQQQQQQQQ